MNARTILLLPVSITAAGLFTLFSSLAFCAVTQRIMVMGLPRVTWSWWTFLLAGAPYPGDARALLVSAVVGVLPFVAIGLMPRKVPAGPSRIRRGNSGIHGDSRWLTMRAALAMLPPVDDGVQVVLGEAIRMDLSPVANVRFRPRHRRTWGAGGTGRLLFDAGEEMGGGHGVTFLAPGGGKTQEIATAIFYYGRSVFVHDPACELADLTGEIQRDKGHKVYVLDKEGRTGFNALAWIRIDDPLAEVNVRAQVERMYGKTVERPGQAAGAMSFFRDQGKNLVTCILAHMLWDPDTKQQHKTLRAVRRALSRPGGEMRLLLEGIYLTSASDLARDLAGPLFDMVPETFDGITSNAQEGTAWLSTPAYANMVSGSSYDPAELCDGRMTVYCQIPMKSLLVSPEVSRVVVGAHMGAVFEAEGKVEGRVLFALDEAVLLGGDSMLRVGRSQGRKYGVLLNLYYQSIGQGIEVWGKDGLRGWMSEVSWIRFGATMDTEDGAALCKLLGEYGAVATSQGKNTGRSGRLGEQSSSSRGENSSEHEVKRPLLYPTELARLRRDERIVCYVNSMPIRCTAALAHRRPEISCRMGRNRFGKRVQNLLGFRQAA